MKILLVTPYYRDSFAQNLSMGSAVKQAENLSRKHKLLVLTTGRSQKKEQPSKNLTILSVSGWLIPDPVNYVVSFSFYVELLKHLSSFKPDVVMVSKYMFFTSFAIPIARILGFKVITTTDTFPGINWFPKSRLVGAVMWLYARLIGLPLLWLSNKVILLYPGLEKEAKKHRLNYVTILNGVDESYFQKQPHPKDIKKPKGEFWVGFVGRPESVKGYDLALKIAGYFESRDPKIKFVFVGGQVEPHRMGNRIYLGFRNDIKSLYQLFDCLILPSIDEGLPNVLMEAMAQGVICVVNGVGGVRWLIADKRNGVIVPRNNALSYQRSLITLKKSKALARNIKASAPESIHKTFNWKYIAPSYDRLIHSLISK